MHKESHKISIIIPIKDEEDNIRPLAEELSEAFNNFQWNWECIWIDDGSKDNSLNIIEAISKEDNHHKFIAFEKNSGQSAALWAGFLEAKGEIIATIDGDGQNDPADLPRLIELLITSSDKWDMVNGYRAKRQDNIIRKIASKIGNGMRNLITGKTVRDVGCSTRAFKRECVKYLPLFKGMHRFLPTLVAMQGYKLTEVPVNHRPRKRGISKYTINNRLWVGIADLFGVFWLRKRLFHFKIKKKSY